MQMINKELIPKGKCKQIVFDFAKKVFHNRMLVK